MTDYDPERDYELATQARAEGVRYLSRGTREERDAQVIAELAEALEKGMDEATVRWGEDRARGALLILCQRILDGDIE